MKKSLIAVFGAMLATAACADYVLTFETVGPDKYNDGSTVMDGEKYALVWTPTGSTFAGFNADGSAVAPSKVAIAAPVAKGGKCPRVLFAVTDEALGSYAGGTWGVYLLDTRVWPVDENGVVNGEPTLNNGKVNGYGEVAAKAGTGFTKAEGVTTASAISGAKLSIKSIGFDGDNVLITVQGVAGKFKLCAGTDPENVAEVSTGASETTEAVIIRPKKENGEFFSVK